MDLKAGVYDAEEIMGQVRKDERGFQTDTQIDSYKHARALAKGEEQGNNDYNN